MEKPILATNIDGFLIDHSAFIEPHKIWFDRAILLTKDESLAKWKGHKNYFVGVNEAMEKIMPDSTKQQRTEQARKWYQEDVITYIRLHPEIINSKLKKILLKLKEKFALALITTNTEDYISKILQTANLGNVYDIVYASKTSEEPNKEDLFSGFKQKYHEPKYYIASRSLEAFEACKKLGTICIYFSPRDSDDKIRNLVDKTITSRDQLLSL